MSGQSGLQIGGTHPCTLERTKDKKGHKSPPRNPQDWLQPLEKGKASGSLNGAGLWGGKTFVENSSSFPTPVNGAVALTFLWKSTQGFKDGKCCFSTVIFIQRECFRGRRGFSTSFNLFFFMAAHPRALREFGSHPFWAV